MSFVGLRWGITGGGDHPWPPRRQGHHQGGRTRLSRRGTAPAADGARRRGRDEQPHLLHRAARRGAERPRGDVPGAAGGGGPRLDARTRRRADDRFGLLAEDRGAGRNPFLTGYGYTLGNYHRLTPKKD